MRETPPSELWNPAGLARRGPDALQLDTVILVLRRQLPGFLMVVAMSMMLGCATIILATPLYSASASILIDQDNKSILDDSAPAPVASQAMDATSSQVELIKSRRVAARVVHGLKLDGNAAFQASLSAAHGGALAFLRHWLSASPDVSATAVAARQAQFMAEAYGLIEKRLSVKRADEAAVINLTYSAETPELAAQMAAGFAEAYLAERVDAKAEAARRTADWLAEKLVELRAKALTSDRAIQTFRTRNGLLASDGQLISDQNLTQLNTQLVLAQTEAGNAEARYRRIAAILTSHDMEAAVAETLDSRVMDDLRSKYLDASRRAADISARLGKAHQQVLRLNREMAEYRRVIFDELARIAATYRSNLDVAKSRRDMLATEVARASLTSTDAADAGVALRELQSEAASHKQLYESFLARHQSMLQQQSFPAVEARVISNPQTPFAPSSPKKTLIMAFSLFVGIVGGLALAITRELGESGFRTADQLRQALGMPVFGLAPALRRPPDNRPDFQPFALVHDRLIRISDPIDQHVLDQPLSLFSETLAATASVILPPTTVGEAIRIGIASSLPGEGKSTLAINFALQQAQAGRRVLLVDADLRNPGASRRLAAHATGEYAPAAYEQKPLRDRLLLHPECRLAFLPAAAASASLTPLSVLAAPRFADALNEAGRLFDLVVVDLPPLAPISDAEILAAQLDAFIWVVAWGATHQRLVEQTLASHPAVARKCAGVILNKVVMRKLKHYQPAAAVSYDSARYQGYFSD